MSTIKNSDVFKSFTDNDLFEYREVCKEIKEYADLYAKKIKKGDSLNDFFLDYVFNTSHSCKFYNMEVQFIIKKRFRKKKVFFVIKAIEEISRDDYLDIIFEIKKSSHGEKEK